MARLKSTPRKPPDFVLTPRSHPPIGNQVRGVSESRKRSTKEETGSISSQEPHPVIKSDAEKESIGLDMKGKMPAVDQSHANDEVQQEIEEEEEEGTESEEGDGDADQKLIKELKAFREFGLMTKINPGEEEEEASDEVPCYGAEVKKKYPCFFLLIPQKPHYQGLLLDTVEEGIKKMVYQALWYNLVELMEKVLQTNFLTNRREIEVMKQQAMGLEKLGFDVRHMKARLRQPTCSKYDLKDASDRLHLAKKRKRDMEEKIMELEMLEAKAAKFKMMLSDVETKILQLKAVIGRSFEEQASTLWKLTKCVEDEERNFQETLDSCKSLD